MVAVSHVLFIDESGNADTGRTVTSLWVTAAMAVPFEGVRDLNDRVESFTKHNFRSRVKEAKGSDVPHELAGGRTTEDLARDLASLLREFESHVWIAAASRQEDGPTTKGKARQLVLERVNGFLNLGGYEPAHWLIVWDVSDVEELGDFSRSVSDFRNDYSGEPRNERLFPSVLGGLSHDWGGLQAADLLSNFALHYQGREQGFLRVNLEKARTFDAHLMPCLQKTAAGNIVGWKTW